MNTEHSDMGKLKFILKPEHFCIHRLPIGTAINYYDKLTSANWYSLTRTDDELSVVAPCEIKLDSEKCEPDWSCLRIAGQLDFSLIGVIAEVARILADAGISIFTVSTYDTDYILVKNVDVNQAIVVLSAAGHEVEADSISSSTAVN
ncbi:MAG: ACT domain-containing protein [Chromatiales bacterium]|jgi:hypothetical protein